jgi:hypothetical protein
VAKRIVAVLLGFAVLGSLFPVWQLSVAATHSNSVLSTQDATSNLPSNDDKGSQTGGNNSSTEGANVPTSESSTRDLRGVETTGRPQIAGDPTFKPKPIIESAEAVPFRLVSFTEAPHNRARVGRLFVLRGNVENRQDKRDVVTVVCSISGRPTEQYARQVILGPKENRIIDCAIPIPDDFNAKRIEFVCTLRRKEGDREVLLESSTEPIEQRLTVEIDATQAITATYLDRSPPPSMLWEWPKKDLHVSYEWVVANRISAGMNRALTGLEPSIPPRELADWDSIDNVVVSDSRFFRDYATLSSFKAWLMSGGRLWVMLDKVEAKYLRDLLLPGQYVEELERTEITSAVLESDLNVDPNMKRMDWTSEKGVALVQVEQKGGMVTHRVDGWPAAIWMPIGDGSILLTTLGPEGWVEQREAQQEVEPIYQSELQVRSWVGPLAERFLQPRSRLLAKTPGLQLPVSQIGIRILDKRTIAVVLTTFCALLVAASLWLWKSRKMEWVGWVGPALSLLVGGSLALASASLRREVPEGWHRLQVVTTDGAGTAVINEQSAVYRASSTNFPLKMKSDGIVDPAVSAASRDFRTTQNDLTDSSMQSESWPTGIWRMEAWMTENKAFGVARGEWSRDGLSVSLPEEVGKLTDMIVAMPRAPKGIVESVGETSGLVRESNALPPGEFATSAGLVDEKFVDRAEVLQRVFLPREGEASPKHLQLMGWRDTIEQGSLYWEEGSEKRDGTGSSLLRIPLVNDVPVPNTEVLVPPSLIQLDSIVTDVGQSGAFMRTSGEWNGPFTTSMTTGLRVELPQELYPFKSKGIRLVFRIRAPGRDVSVVAIVDDKKIKIGDYSSPQQVIRLDIDDPEILKMLDKKRFDLNIEVSSLKGSGGDSGMTQAASWQIEYLWVTVEGIANYRETK